MVFFYTDPLVVDNWEEHVHSPTFDRECNAQSKRLLSSSSSRYRESSESIRLWQDDDSSESSHEVPYLYYFGLRGNRHPGPKLIFRTSTDVFVPPTGPEHDPRVMQLLSVYDHNKLGKNKLWTTIREKVSDLLDA